ncbi:MAG: LytTR family transcriptional regulator [Lachnospiraceae bacterium]|nr:LytTR family transcriptional regulator [Lachnospiraceae bacterium]
MTSMVDLEVVLDEECFEPKVKIHTKSRTDLVEKIIGAIEKVTATEFPFVTGHLNGKVELISQRDIVRVRTEGRRLICDTDEDSFVVRRSLTSLEEVLDRDRFCRISQSEIINLYKVKCFDISMAGTIIVEFDNGIQSWVARRYMKTIRDICYDR